MTYRIEVAADMGEVVDARHLEIPVQGPEGANLLVFINGVTLKGLDTDDDFRTRAFSPVNFFIDTDYKLRDDDRLIQSSAYACLSSIGADDSTPFLLALDETIVKVRTSRVIQLYLNGAVEGDTALYRIGYQVNLLVLRTR
jgi:hypothetical protein